MNSGVTFDVSAIARTVYNVLVNRESLDPVVTRSALTGQVRAKA
jgi:hypothetical protein